MIGWYHRLSGHEFEQTPRDGKRQGSLVCFPWTIMGSQTAEHDLATEQQQQKLHNKKSCLQRAYTELMGSC